MPPALEDAIGLAGDDGEVDEAAGKFFGNSLYVAAITTVLLLLHYVVPATPLAKCRLKFNDPVKKEFESQAPRRKLKKKTKSSFFFLEPGPESLTSVFWSKLKEHELSLVVLCSDQGFRCKHEPIPVKPKKKHGTEIEKNSMWKAT